MFLAPRRRLEAGLPARLAIELAVVVTGAINARTAATKAPA
jgi:hypothetical protein